MTPVRTPRSLDAATALLERHASLGARVARLEAQRQEAVAQANALTDAEVTPLVEEQDKIKGALEPWWATAAAALTKGKRKSIELGGCTIGTAAGRTRLEFASGDAKMSDDRAALAAVETARLNAKVTVVQRVLDKRGIAALLKAKGAIGVKLAAIGFRMAGGEESFFVERVNSPDAKVSAA